MANEEANKAKMAKLDEVQTPKATTSTPSDSALAETTKTNDQPSANPNAIESTPVNQTILVEKESSPLRRGSQESTATNTTQTTTTTTGTESTSPSSSDYSSSDSSASESDSSSEDGGKVCKYLFIII